MPGSGAHVETPPSEWTESGEYRIRIRGSPRVVLVGDRFNEATPPSLSLGLGVDTLTAMERMTVLSLTT